MQTLFLAHVQIWNLAGPKWRPNSASSKPARCSGICLKGGTWPPCTRAGSPLLPPPPCPCHKPWAPMHDGESRASVQMLLLSFALHSLRPRPISLLPLCAASAMDASTASSLPPSWLHASGHLRVMRLPPRHVFHAAAISCPHAVRPCCHRTPPWPPAATTYARVAGPVQAASAWAEQPWGHGRERQCRGPTKPRPPLPAASRRDRPRRSRVPLRSVPWLAVKEEEKGTDVISFHSQGSWCNTATQKEFQI